jgi:hypothetical protein
MDEDRRWWVIKVSGYGAFAYYGTENEAEDMRVHKSRWERAAARKRRVGRNHELVRRRIEWVKVEIANGYPRSDEREKAEAACVTAMEHS